MSYRRNYFISFLIMMLLLFKLGYSQNTIDVAVNFIDSLRKESPKVHGIPLNNFFLNDLNHDGVFEVVERINKIENEAPGFLSAELSKAFEFDNIYVFNKSSNNYELNFRVHKDYLIKRKKIYEFWVRQIKNPKQLNYDSQELIKINKERFLSELLRLINLIENDIY